MFPDPEYPDFYVAVLTIVPIVLVGQLVVWRLPDNALGDPRVNRALTIGLSAVSVLAAFVLIGAALAVLAGIELDTRQIRAQVLGLTIVQVATGLLGMMKEAMPAPRRSQSK
jgi:hypothetical protein